MYFLANPLLMLLFYVIGIQCCAKVTFVNTIIKVARRESYNIEAININERFTASITGCITPEKILEELGKITVVGIECKDQNVPILYEGAVSSLQELGFLYISYSKVRTIKHKSFFNLPKLTSLTLSHNEIEVIDNNAFADLNMLLSLDLIGNKIAFLEPGIFASLPKLVSISLSYNDIEIFESEWFSENSVLHSIAIDNNFIRSINKNTFQPFKALNELDLNSNRIQHIHKDAFDNLGNLNYLYLYNNTIRKLEPDVFKGLKNVSAVWIYGNNLTYVPDKILDDLNSPNLFQLTIHTNPWQCACYQKLAKWAAKRKVYIVTGIECYNDNNPVCLYPVENEDLCLENLDEDLNKKFYDLYNVYNPECADE